MTEALIKPPKKSINIGYETYIQYYTDDKRKIIGFIEWHRQPSGLFHGGSVLFDKPSAQRFRSKRPDGGLTPVWQVVQWKPLTLSPSIACGDCPHHGFIRNGNWIPA